MNSSSCTNVSEETWSFLINSNPWNMMKKENKLIRKNIWAAWSLILKKECTMTLSFSSISTVCIQVLSDNIISVLVCLKGRKCPCLNSTNQKETISYQKLKKQWSIKKCETMTKYKLCLQLVSNARNKNGVSCLV